MTQVHRRKQDAQKLARDKRQENKKKRAEDKANGKYPDHWKWFGENNEDDDYVAVELNHIETLQPTGIENVIRGYSSTSAAGVLSELLKSGEWELL